jgi:nucleotide-binding universal stress UspA family protein
MKPKVKTPPRRAEPGLKGMRRSRVRHILVPIDFSPISRKAVRYARPLARHFGAPVTLLHVVAPVVYDADYGYGVVTRRILDTAAESAAQRRIRSMIRHTTAKPVCKWQPLVRCGFPLEEIVNAARKLKADLIVMGESSSKHGELSRALTTAREAARRVTCPVLVVREHGTELVKKGKEYEN